MADADGFFTNVSNFNPTSSEAAYGRSISSALAGQGIANKHQVIDTSRNGGASGDWCGDDNTDRRIGQYPTTATNDSNIDAYLWVKPPGEADGCKYAAGSFQPDLAYSLANGAPNPPTTAAATTPPTDAAHHPADHAADHAADHRRHHDPADDGADHPAGSGRGLLGDLPGQQLVAGRLPGPGHGDRGQLGDLRLDGHLDAPERPEDHPGVERHADHQRIDRHGPQRGLQRLAGGPRQHPVRLHRQRRTARRVPTLSCCESEPRRGNTAGRVGGSPRFTRQEALLALLGRGAHRAALRATGLGGQCGASGTLLSSCNCWVTWLLSAAW